MLLEEIFVKHGLFYTKDLHEWSYKDMHGIKVYYDVEIPENSFDGICALIEEVSVSQGFISIKHYV
nr:MAG TPA: hypothetical protein [Caudoviricetes sp.]